MKEIDRIYGHGGFAMKNKELDHVYREILRMLQEDARMSLKDIAEAVFCHRLRYRCALTI